MGYMRHHAIIVTDAGYGDSIEKAHVRAIKIFRCVSPILESEWNHHRSFFIPPDGSKEGWSESEIGDKQRDTFIAHLETYRYEDGSSPIDWVEVQFGDDELETKVTRDGDERRRNADATLDPK